MTRLSRSSKIVSKLMLAASLIIGLCSCSDHQQPEDRWEQAVEGSSAAALSADGKFAIHASTQLTIDDSQATGTATVHNLALWDNEKQGLLYLWQLDGANHPVYLARFSPNGDYVVTASENQLSIWSVSSGESLGWYSIGDERIRDIAISDDGASILYGLSSGKAVYLNRETGRRLEFLGHIKPLILIDKTDPNPTPNAMTGKINAVDLSANGQYAITGGSDYSAKLWSTQTGQIVQQFNHPSRVTQVRFDQQGRYAFTADSLKQARIWKIPSGAMVSQLKYRARQHVFSAARFSEDGKWLATGSPSKELELWQVDSGERVASWRVSRQTDNRWRSAVVYDVAFNKDKLYSVSSAGYTESWALPSELQRTGNKP